LYTLLAPRLGKEERVRQASTVSLHCRDNLGYRAPDRRPADVEEL